MQPNLLDVNIKSNNLNPSQVDFVLLIRKMVKALPNAFVRVRSPFDGSLCSIETKVVNQSCYPYWLGQNFKLEFPLTPNNIQKM